jgi:hypothetical protein
MVLKFLDRLLQGFKHITVSSCYRQDFEIYLKDVSYIRLLDYWERPTESIHPNYIEVTANNVIYILSSSVGNYLHISEEDFNYLLEFYNKIAVR